MKTYSQIDPRWKDKKLGGSTFSIGGFGCFLASIAMLAQTKDPLELNEIGIREGCFTPHGLLISPKLAEIVGLSVIWVDGGLNFETPPAEAPCIAITDYYKSRGVPTHFFVYLPDGRIIDPLDADPAPKENTLYKITGFRQFTGVKLQTIEKDWKDFAREYAMSGIISNGERPADNLTRVENWETLRKFEEYLAKKYNI